MASASATAAARYRMGNADRHEREGYGLLVEAGESGTMKSEICAGCGKCCTDQEFPLFEEEYVRIQPYLKNRPPIEMENGLIKFATGKEPCPALDADGCRIPYKKRPNVCKLFPFIPKLNPPGIFPSVTCPRYKKFTGDLLRQNEIVIFEELKEWAHIRMLWTTKYQKGFYK